MRHHEPREPRLLLVIEGRADLSIATIRATSAAVRRVGRRGGMIALAPGAKLYQEIDGEWRPLAIDPETHAAKPIWSN